MEGAVAGEAFDGGDRRAVHLDGKARARFDGDAVQEHRAGAALAGIAADLGAGERRELADEVHEQRPRLDIPLIGAAVD